ITCVTLTTSLYAIHTSLSSTATTLEIVCPPSPSSARIVFQFFPSYRYSAPGPDAHNTPLGANDIYSTSPAIPTGNGISWGLGVALRPSNLSRCARAVAQMLPSGAAMIEINDRP